ncbi:MAG: excinuclease ABC subunit UvrA [Bacteroidales bacterium]|nr:excinuclease ABC subunit UvrA [Bacteroidales bacterium]MBN2756328.1 excinuclease ABC subunit UvrA [Bacteroidales bacterium]
MNCEEFTENIKVCGARVHNLKNIDVEIPRNKLCVITGLSGSGKSSLAFDTIYAEGQRRYIETFSSYARQFLGNLERPDVDKITGLSPVISIEQKTSNKNPRSTVGTITEIYDFLRLLYARASIAYSSETEEEMVKYTDDQIVDLIVEKFKDKKIYLLAPIVRSRKGHYRELFEQIRKKGFLWARINGEIKELVFGLKLDRYKTHNIEIVVDKMNVSVNDRNRLKKSVDTAMQNGKGTIAVLDYEDEKLSYFSRKLMCPSSGISYDEPAPNTFSFNSPQGACPTCKGLGVITQIDVAKVIIDNKLSINEGGIIPLGKSKDTLIFWQLEAIGKKFNFKLSDSIKKIPEEALNIILYGSEQTFVLENTPLGAKTDYALSFDGIYKYIERYQKDKSSLKAQKWAEKFHTKSVCHTCNGSRIKEEALQFKIAEKNISELVAMDISELQNWISTVEEKLNEKQKIIAKEIFKEIKSRLQFLVDVGLSYLSLNRTSKSLSGGESQRIRLATQIGSQLVNVLYILDEPSIGLHQRDNRKLINSLKQLRDNENSVIVVEHDKDMILSADYIIDIGPKAGKYGGEIVAKGNAKDFLNCKTLTTDYIKNIRRIEIPEKRREGTGETIVLKGAKGNNLKNVKLVLPLGKLVCVTGVSGSGKSSLINETLHPILSKHFFRSLKDPLKFDSIEGISNIDKVIEVDQSPIGRTPRSNPATYTGVFSDIRSLYEKLPESQIRGYKSGRFSFNVKGGRCETCQGAGLRTIEMNFLPDVYVHCDECQGRRYNRETLEVRYKGKSISDVLDMTINTAVDFFENIPKILKKLKALKNVGLGYITLGQASTTLSGGEAQRVKLATELAKKDTGKTLFILDEPTTGLHFEDIRVLLGVLNRLVNKGNTVLIIEHNMDVIKTADYIIDLGPEGGKKGGYILAEGTPEEIIKQKKGYTAKYLKEELV